MVEFDLDISSLKIKFEICLRYVCFVSAHALFAPFLCFAKTDGLPYMMVYPNWWFAIEVDRHWLNNCPFFSVNIKPMQHAVLCAFAELDN